MIRRAAEKDTPSASQVEQWRKAIQELLEKSQFILDSSSLLDLGDVLARAHPGGLSPMKFYVGAYVLYVNKQHGIQLASVSTRMPHALSTVLPYSNEGYVKQESDFRNALWKVYQSSQGDVKKVLTALNRLTRRTWTV